MKSRIYSRRAPAGIVQELKSAERRERRNNKKKRIKSSAIVSIDLSPHVCEINDPSEMIASIEICVKNCSERTRKRLEIEILSIDLRDVPAEYTILKNFIVRKTTPRPEIM